MCRILTDDMFTGKLSETEQKAAAEQYNGDENYRRLLEIYREIV